MRTIGLGMSQPNSQIHSAWPPAFPLGAWTGFDVCDRGCKQHQINHLLLSITCQINHKSMRSNIQVHFQQKSAPFFDDLSKV
jgi:hypothetical protein